MRVNSDLKSVQLILDMKVRWSSTYYMLDRAENKKRFVAHYKLNIANHLLNLQCIDSFVDELRWEEKNSAKRDKIHGL